MNENSTLAGGREPPWEQRCGPIGNRIRNERREQVCLTGAEADQTNQE